MAAIDVVDRFTIKELDTVAQRSMSMHSATIKEVGEVPTTHAADFERRTGMSPKACYQLVLISLTLRAMASTWVGMVSLEYGRYYVINDLATNDIIRVATGSPQHAVQAFLFPFWGVVADRASRKKIIAASSLATFCSVFLLALAPSVEVYIVTRVLSLVSDVGGPIRDAMLRDIFSTDQWERSNGGATGLKARMYMVAQLAVGVATAVGMGLLKLGEYGYGLPNEYTAHKHECGRMHCLQPGHWSWEGPWRVDGCLRLLMLMGSAVFAADACLVCLVFPETLPPEFRREGSVCQFLRHSWHQAGRPWDNLRVLATRQLRSLMAIRFLSYAVAAGGGSIFMCFYARFQFDTFTMTAHVVLCGVGAWFISAAIGRLVDRFGDLRGIWLPQNILILIYGVSCALLPTGHGYMMYALSPAFAGTATGLNMVTPELLAKLIPSDLQGTFQTAKSFIFHITMAVFAWPWNQMFLATRASAYPFDVLPIWVSIFIGLVALWLTIRQLLDDPRHAITQGKALEAFWDSPYAKGAWYLRHASGQPAAPEKKCEEAADGAAEEKKGPEGQEAAGEAAAKGETVGAPAAPEREGACAV